MLRSNSSLRDPQTTLARVEEPLEQPAGPGRNGAWRKTNHWTRWLHVYTSMIALLVVLFFGLTGITLNHPDWTFGFQPTTETSSGILPDGWVDPDGTVEFLTVSEFLRGEHGVNGDVTDFGTDSTDGWVSYRGPGYSAEAFFDLGTGAYTLRVEQQGWIGVMNDLHKGRDTDTSWNWLIDVSGGLLVLIAVTGLGIQLLMRKRRRSALAWALAGTLICVALIVITTS